MAEEQKKVSTLKFPLKFERGIPWILFTNYIYSCPLPKITYLSETTPRVHGGESNIALYMPGDFVESSSATWGLQDVFQGGGNSTLTGIIAANVDKSTQNTVVANLNESVKAGAAMLPFPTDINVFKSMEPLGFTLNFNMIPFNLTEAQNISWICNTFKNAMVPHQGDLLGAKNAILKFPLVWDVRFEGITGVGYTKQDDGKSETFQNMAITNVSVSYISGTENATVYTSDPNSKYPTQTKLSVSFISIRKFFL